MTLSQKKKKTLLTLTIKNKMTTPYAPNPIPIYALEEKERKFAKLYEKLPDWAIKPHPTKTKMTVIHPMAVVDRLNEVFGIGGWNTKVEYLKSYEWMQATQKGERKVYSACSKVILDVPEYDIHLEQFGGSTNDDEGDALKGSATDGLTKIASYLGIGAEIYKGHGNINGGDEPEEEINNNRASGSRL